MWQSRPFGTHSFGSRILGGILPVKLQKPPRGRGHVRVVMALPGDAGRCLLAGQKGQRGAKTFMTQSLPKNQPAYQ